MIFLDLDSTLNDLIYKWVDYMNHKENKNHKVRDIQFWEHILNLYNNPLDFFHNAQFKTVELFDGAKDLINELKKYDEVVILTDNFDFAKRDKISWLCKQNLNVPVIFTNQDKISYLSKNDIFIDDRLKTILEVEEVCDNVILYNHNDDYNYSKGGNKKTAYSFQHILKEVKKIKKEDHD